MQIVNVGCTTDSKRNTSFYTYMTERELSSSFKWLVVLRLVIFSYWVRFASSVSVVPARVNSNFDSVFVELDIAST